MSLRTSSTSWLTVHPPDRNVAAASVARLGVPTVLTTTSGSAPRSPAGDDEVEADELGAEALVRGGELLADERGELLERGGIVRMMVRVAEAPVVLEWCGLRRATNATMRTTTPSAANRPPASRSRLRRRASC